ncbi:MAG: energy-coupling factor transporter transmembrane protein EcfT [Nitrososphaeria archaeon]
MPLRFQFEYLNIDSPIHRMHVISKFILIFSLAMLSNIWMDPRFIAIVLLIILALWFIAKIPKRWFIIPLLFSLGTQWAQLLFTYPFLSYSFKVLPSEYANQILFEIGYIPTVGRAVYTIGSVWYFFAFTLRYFSVVSAAMMIYFTTPISDMVQYLLKFKKIPNSLIFSIIIIFKFFPVMSKLGAEAVNAMNLRGWSSSRNPVKFVKMMLPLLTIISKQFMIAVQMVSISLVNRAFGANPMVPHKNLPMAKKDYLIVISSLIAIITAYYLAITPPYIGNL